MEFSWTSVIFLMENKDKDWKECNKRLGEKLRNSKKITEEGERRRKMIMKKKEDEKRKNIMKKEKREWNRKKVEGRWGKMKKKKYLKITELW